MFLFKFKFPNLKTRLRFRKIVLSEKYENGEFNPREGDLNCSPHEVNLLLYPQQNTFLQNFCSKVVKTEMENFMSLCCDWVEIAVNVCFSSTIPATSTTRFWSWMKNLITLGSYNTDVENLYEPFAQKPNNLTKTECLELFSIIYKRFLELDFFDQHPDGKIESPSSPQSNNRLYITDFLLYLNFCAIISVIIVHALFKTDPNEEVTAEREAIEIKPTEAEAYFLAEGLEIKANDISANDEQDRSTGIAETVTIGSEDSVNVNSLASIEFVNTNETIEMSDVLEDTQEIFDLTSPNVSDKIIFFNDMSENGSSSKIHGGSAESSKSSLMADTPRKGSDKRIPKNFLEINIKNVQQMNPSGSAHRLGSEKQKVKKSAIPVRQSSSFKKD